MKILCVEDDEALAALLEQVLIKQHYQVELATDGLMGWNLAETETYDLILLDWILPELTGLEFCHRLRTEKHSLLNPNQDTPVLLMTAMDAITNKVMGLNAGADDYIVKPFDLDELLARIRALIRRNQTIRSPLLEWGEICLNPNSCEVTYQRQPILLAAKEYELLELFLRNPDRIFSLNRLLTALWKVEEMPAEGAVRAHIKGLRQKLKQAGADDPIETLYKLGYRLRPSKISSEEKGTAPSASVHSDLWEVWQEVRPSYCDRLAIVQQAVTALQNQTLTPDRRYQAEREAHTLIGSLGSFGLEEASLIARQIQQILQQSTPLGKSDLKKLLPLVAALGRHLDISTNPKTATITPQDLPPIPLLLIVDDDSPWAQELAKEVSSWGFQAERATTLQDAQPILQTGAIATLLLNLDCVATNGQGLNFLAKVRSHYPQLPIVTLTAADSLELRLQVARLGTQCFLKQPLTPTQVLTAIAPIIQLSQASPPRILIVDRDPIGLQFLETLLDSKGYQAILLRELETFWSTLEQTNPDLLIVELELCLPSSFPTQPHPPFSSIEICQALRIDPAWHRLPILFLSASQEDEAVHRCLMAGADDCLKKPIVAPDLLTRVRIRLERRKRWESSIERPLGRPDTLASGRK